MALKTTIQLRRDALSAWLEANPVLQPGEIALVDRNNGNGVKDWVVRVGDGVSTFNQLPETAYALSTDVATQISNLSAELKTDITGVTQKVDNKVKVDDVATETLNIKRIDAAAYHELVVGGTVDNNTIYIVSSDHLNAFGEKITNVKDGEEAGDAVNYGQLSSAVNTLEGRINDIVAEGLGVEVVKLSTDLNTVSADVIAVDEKVDAVSAEVDVKLNALSGEASTLISAVDGKVDKLSGEVIALTEAHEDDITKLSSDLSIELVDNGRAEGTDTISYTLKQGGVEKGTIVVPYDVFVDKGELVEKDDGKTYIVLTLNNAAQSKLEFEVSSLIDVYTGGATETITTEVDNYQITATVNDGSISTAKIADGAITSAKFADEVFVFDCGGAKQETEQA